MNHRKPIPTAQQPLQSGRIKDRPLNPLFNKSKWPTDQERDKMVLKYLQSTDEWVSVSRISVHTKQGDSAIARCLFRLEKAGLLEKKSNGSVIRWRLK